jgi:hypothetical protein
VSYETAVTRSLPSRCEGPGYPRVTQRVGEVSTAICSTGGVEIMMSRYRTKTALSDNPGRDSMCLICAQIKKFCSIAELEIEILEIF